MQGYLQLLLLSLLIGLLSFYIAGVSITRSFDIPALEALKEQVHQQEDMKALSQQLMRRQKTLLQQRKQEFKYTMRAQKQKIRESARALKEKMRDARYR